jgi:divalent metal cation (Fe/Co/Zn/Cd) transporter
MGLETPTQKLWAFGISLAFLAVLVLAGAAVLTSLSDDNIDSFANWLEDNLDAIGAGLLAVVPSITTYLFGRRAGRKVGKTEAYNSAIATVAGRTDADAAAETLRQEARAHDLRVTT